MLVNLPLKKML